MSPHYKRLPHGWRQLDSEQLEALMPGLSDSDADMVDAELASRTDRQAVA